MLTVCQVCFSVLFINTFNSHTNPKRRWLSLAPFWTQKNRVSEFFNLPDASFNAIQKLSLVLSAILYSSVQLSPCSEAFTVSAQILLQEDMEMQGGGQAQIWLQGKEEKNWLSDLQRPALVPACAYGGEL